MKKLLIFVILLCAGVFLISCTGTMPGDATASVKTPAELSEAIVNARTGELNDAFAIFAASQEEAATYTHNPMQVSEEGMPDEITALMQITGIDYDNCESYAMTLSMMNIHAYATGIFYPLEGSEESVQESLQNFITAKQLEFENYLPDQYEIAENAILRTTTSGAIILVIAEDAQETADTIEQALA